MREEHVSRPMTWTQFISEVEYMRMLQKRSFFTDDEQTKTACIAAETTVDTRLREFKKDML